MALSILTFLSIDKGHVKFRIDTGTNKFYFLKVGENFEERNGLKLITTITEKTQLKINERANGLLNSSDDISLPINLFSKKSCYVQLFSFKSKEGKSLALSRVIKVPMALVNMENDFGLSTSASLTQNVMENIFLNPHRLIPHNGDNYQLSLQTSFEDILTNLVRMAGPIVMGLLSGMQNNSSPISGTPTTGTAAATSPVSMLNTMLDAVINGLRNPAAALATTGLAATHSMSNSFSTSFNASRFSQPASVNNFSKPFIFGIDDALIASLVGPVLQVLPQLVNANNAAKLQNKQANNSLITGLVGEVNRRMMLQQFLDSQSNRAGGSTLPPGVNMEQLLQLLQQVAPPVAAPPAVVAPAVAASLSVGDYVSTLSTKTILSFETAGTKTFCEKELIVFQKSNAIKLKVKLNITEPAPKTALPKAIVKFVFKDAVGKTLLEKIFKQKDVMPNTVLLFDFSAQELSSIPINKSILIVAEMKWLTTSNREIKTLGSTEIILAENYFLKSQLKEEQDEKELTDMKVYRSFWNKIWEPPLLDKLNAGNDGYKKFIWELDANIRYTILLSADATSNGLMETKILKAENEFETLTEKTEGRIKGGIELSIAELNKMSTLWDKQMPLSPDKLNALKTDYFSKKNAFEFVTKIKLKGKNDERGLVWIIPTLQLNSLVLHKIKKTDECGQVTETEEETILFPLPKSARILGLKTA